MSIVDFRKYARDYYHAKIKTKPPILPANIEHKVCEKCKQEKPIKNFHPRVTRKDGYQAWCKDCLRESLRQSRKRRLEKIKKDGTLKEHSAAEREKKRIYKLQKDYGLTVDAYNAILESQNHRCAICKGSDPGKSVTGNQRKWNVDHNHTTGKIRGLLCNLCNTALGSFRDDKTKLMNAVEYLEKNGE